MQQKSASLEEKEKLENHIYAGVVELADTPDLGSGARACRFKSCYPQTEKQSWRVSGRAVFMS